MNVLKICLNWKALVGLTAVARETKIGARS